MRHIVSCASCSRQYRANGRNAGDRFHCHCGALLVVPAARKNLSARVVRCSSCGAPREKGAAACPHCQSDFTLHEKDLHTVCPDCTARVSDKANFCHHCGTAIKPEFDAGTASDWHCPACSHRRRMRARDTVTGVSFHECDLCAGIWVGRETVSTLIKQAEKDSLNEAFSELFPISYDLEKPAPTAGGPFYRKCPACRATMARKNFGGNSGVIVDFCREHGFWFDCNELAKVLKWIRSGGHHRSAAFKQELAQANLPVDRSPEALKNVAKVLNTEAKGSGPWRKPQNSALEATFSLLASAVGALFDFDAD